MPPAFTLSQDQTLQKRVVRLTHRLESNDSMFIIQKNMTGDPSNRSHKITFKEQPIKWGKPFNKTERFTVVKTFLKIEYH